MSWLSQNAGTLLVLALVAAAVAAVVCKMIRDRKNHVSSCGGGCAGCPMRGKCH